MLSESMAASLAEYPMQRWINAASDFVAHKTNLVELNDETITTISHLGLSSRKLVKNINAAEKTAVIADLPTIEERTKFVEASLLMPPMSPGANFANHLASAAALITSRAVDVQMMTEEQASDLRNNMSARISTLRKEHNITWEPVV